MSGGYSTTDGALAEVSVSERNFLGRGLFAKASVTYGQYARGYSLSFVEPYLLDYRVALGLDLFQRQQLANSYISYGTKTLGFSPRLGFALREDLSLQLRYSIYQQEITLPSQLANCNNDLGELVLHSTRRRRCNLTGVPRIAHRRSTSTLRHRPVAATPTAKPRCRSARSWQSGKTLTSALGYSLNYNTLDNNKNPTDGLLSTSSRISPASAAT